MKLLLYISFLALQGKVNILISCLGRGRAEWGVGMRSGAMVFLPGGHMT